MSMFYLRELALCFSILMSIFPTVCFLMFADLKKINFIKPFFLGMLVHVIHIFMVFNIFFRSSYYDQKWFVFSNLDSDLYNILFIILNSLFVVASRIWVFKRISFTRNRKNSLNLFYSAIFFAVGHSTIYNILYNGLIRIFCYDEFLSVRAFKIFIFSFHNFWSIVLDAVFALAIFYVLKKNSRLKFVFLGLILFIYCLILFLSYFFLIKLSWFYNEIFIILITLINFFVCVIFYIKFKNFKIKSR